MKKIVLLGLAVLAGVGTMSARPKTQKVMKDVGNGVDQVVDFVSQPYVLNNPNNRSYFGLRLSGESSIPGTVGYGNIREKMFDAGAGISVGAIYNQPIVANFYVEPGVEFYYDTQKFNIEDDTMQDAHWKSRSTRSFGMRVPVMLGYHFDFSPKWNIAVFTGPVLKVGFSNDYYLTTETRYDSDGVAYRDHSSGTMYDKSNPVDLSQRRVDVAWRIGIGTNFLDHYYIGVSGDLGMINQIKSSNNGAYTMHNNLFQFTLGYNF